MKYNIVINKVNNVQVEKSHIIELNSVGEGIVYRVDPNTYIPGKNIDWSSSSFFMKVKGEKHSVSKVRKLASVNVEKVNSINELVEKVVTENRLLQGIGYLEEVNITKIGNYIQWVKNDVFKEEMDTILESGLEPKECVSAISNKARKFFLDYYNKQ